MRATMLATIVAANAHFCRVHQIVYYVRDVFVFDVVCQAAGVVAVQMRRLGVDILGIAFDLYGL